MSILVENSRDNCQLVAVAAEEFSEVDALHVKVRQDREARLRLILLEKLRLQIHRQVADLLLGEQGFLDLQFCRFGRVIEGLWREVAMPRLDVAFFFACKRDL